MSEGLLSTSTAATGPFEKGILLRHEGRVSSLDTWSFGGRVRIQLRTQLQLPVQSLDGSCTPEQAIEFAQYLIECAEITKKQL